MDRGVLRMIGLAAVLATLLCGVANVRAESFNSTSLADLSRSQIAAFDSWLPYRAEFSEVSGYLESALKLRAGPAIVFTPRWDSDSGASATIPDSVPKRDSDVPGKISDWIDRYNQAADATTTGTSSPSSPERTSNPQSGLPVSQEVIHSVVVSWLSAERSVSPPKPCIGQLFHPPRTALKF